MLFIGDVHKHLDECLGTIKTADRSFVCGDFELQPAHDWHLSNVNPARHKIIFGNHDYMPYLNKPHYIPQQRTMQEQDSPSPLTA